MSTLQTTFLKHPDAAGNQITFTSGGDVNFDNGAVYLDSTNNRLGIGSSAPLTTLECRGQFSISNNSGSYWVLDRDDSDGRLKLLDSSTSTNERLAVDSSGRLLVGTSSARGDYFNTSWIPQLQLEGTGDKESSISLTCNKADTQRPVFIFAKTRGTTVGSDGLVASGDSLGLIAFMGNDGSENVASAYIQAEVDGTPGSNDMPGRLVFSTTADGASSPTERVRIDSSGNLLIGGTYTTWLFNYGGAIYGKGASPRLVLGRSDASDGTAKNCAIFTNSSDNAVGSITVTSTATAFNTSSDYRLKENVTPVTDGITRLQQLKPSRFNFIADPSTVVDGFIAHEVQAVVPEAITGTKDEVDADGTPIYQGIDQSKLVPLLTAALQEAIGEIESLKTRVAALEES